MFKFDGKEALLQLASAAGYKSLSQLVAANTLFAHPNIVSQTKNKNLFRIVRDFPNRGKIIEHCGQQVMGCDNTGPQHAIEWSLGGMTKSDIQINHIYSESKDVTLYTSLANLCATPTFIAKLTDTDKEIKYLLQYRSYELYGFFKSEVPKMPDRYDNLEWMKFVEPISDLEGFLRKRLATCPKSRTAVSAKELGWYFSDYEPDQDLALSRKTG